MKLVVFAHTPPPFHGQSFMVKLMLDNLGGDCRGRPAETQTPAPDPNARIQCFHVNAQFSSDLDQIGLFQVRKLVRVFRYCLEAIWCRFRYRADALYYIPAPPKRIAFYRDCFVMLVCRPVFRHVIYHWEASGLGEWIELHAAWWERRLARWLLGGPDLSVTLAASLSHDAVYFCSKRTHVTPNAVPDPCPDFARSVLPLRVARLGRRRGLLQTSGAIEPYRVIFLAHCTREKGLFDALAAIALADQELDAEELAGRMRITIAGAFLRTDERQEFDSWQREHPGLADYVGFLGENAKARLLRESDCLCFPTYYSAEAQPVSLVEAMAFGLTIVATAWRGIPELLPPDYPFLLADHEPATIARALVKSMQADLANKLRLRYYEAFTAERYVENLTRAFHSLGSVAD